MSFNRTMLALTLGTLLLCCAVDTAFSATPYAGIGKRNLFRLRPPPSLRAPPAKVPLPSVHLTGITTILRGKRALLKVQFPAKPPERPKEESLILSEGERMGPIQVLEINERTSQVKLDNSGTVTNVTFEKIAPAPPPPAPVAPTFRWRGLPYRAASR